MRKTTGIVVALFVLLALAMPAAAKTDRIPFSGVDTFIAQTDPGRQWVSDDGILHVRGSVSTYTSTSDSVYYAGEAVIVVNYNLDLATGNGQLWGTSHLSNGDGGFDGTWVGKFIAYSWEGKGQSKGFGDMAGYQQRFTLQWAPFGDTAEGYTFLPGNK